MPDTVADALIDYAAAVRADRRANPTVAGEGTALELLLAPRFQALVQRIIALRLKQPPSVLPEFRKPGLGRPDLAFKQEGAPARSFIELKQPATGLARTRLKGHDADQFKRFSELPLWGFCNFHTIQLLRRAEGETPVVVVPETTLDPATADTAATRAIRKHPTAAFTTILETLADAPVIRPKTPGEIATNLAQAARLVRAVVEAACRATPPPRALDPVRADFQELLFAHHTAGGYDSKDKDETALFAAAFAQTLAFGMLLAREAGTAQEAAAAAREARPARDIKVDRDANRLLPPGAYPLLRATLAVLTTDPMLDLLGAGFDVLTDTVNAIDTDLLRPTAGRDPVLYLYEEFLEVFDPADRRRHGVFFTPVEIVRYMVAATDRALRDQLGTDGLNDGKVLLLDPACGTGTFLVAAAAHAVATEENRAGDGAIAALRADLAKRLHGFELLVGPYTVAHYRLLRELGATERLPIYLADTLKPPGAGRGINARLGELLGEKLVDERVKADDVKNAATILAVIGNPPYRRLGEGEEARIKSGWDGGFWDSAFKQPVQDAGWGGELNTFPELSVAFWRWSLWKLFECEGAAKRGVLCLITNRTFLSGHPYAGLRKRLRERFDTIDILDLRGGSRGARPAGVTVDENVFDIRVGVCIVTVVASGRKPAGQAALVRYADAWAQGAFVRRDKLALLTAAQVDAGAVEYVPIERGFLDDFVSAAFAGRDWAGLPDAFIFKTSGSQTKRDRFVYHITSAQLAARITSALATSDVELASTFGETRDRKAAPAKNLPLKPSVIEQRSYRPLDRRSLYNQREFVDFGRPNLQAAWGTHNRRLYAMPSGTGAGPAVWVHGLLPDYHAFSGRGGYAFPLQDRRRGPDAHNLNPVLLAGLGDAYGRTIPPEGAFHAIAALLSATTYTARFASDLEEAFPHIPFPADPAVFADAVRIGAEIAALETFARPPATKFRIARLQGSASATTLDAPRDAPCTPGADGLGAIPLLPDQSQRLTRLDPRIWTFAVSGYRVLPRWLAARKGETLDKAFNDALLDIAWRLAELLHWFDAADPILAAAIANPLTRTRLALPASPESPPPIASPDDAEASPPA